MPIVNHTIESGATHHVLRMFDQDNIEYTVTFFAPLADVAAITARHITEMDVNLAKMEFEQIVGSE